MIQIEGTTMATTYHITYFDPKKRNFKESVDSVLELVNKSINTYDPTSEISAFNKSTTGIKFGLPYLLPPLRKAKEVSEASHGAFDPTVMPLVNAWGFGPDKQNIPDSAKLDSLLSLVGFEKIKFSEDSLWKTTGHTQLDFGGIGQGYGADVIANFLRSKGVEDMFVELGGEGLALGRNQESGKAWQIGILDPVDTQKFKAYISLSGRAFTTSGNYYNYREVDGQRFSHTIDPATGRPVQRAILSASVFAPDCTTADAWATALMVMGHEKAIEILDSHPELDAFLVYSTPNGTGTFVTKGISDQLEIVK
jgi:thiamine biosynthesis lipoprotein